VNRLAGTAVGTIFLRWLASPEVPSGSRDCPGSRSVLDAGWELGSARCRSRRPQHPPSRPAAWLRPYPQVTGTRVIGQVRPVVAGDLAHRPFSSRSIGIQQGHVDLGAGLIDDDQILSGQLLGLLPPGRASEVILLASSYRLFFRVQPNTIRVRLIEAGLTLVPVLASHIWQCCSRVASGLASNCSSRPACKDAPLMLGRPGISLGKTCPLSRRALR